MDGASQKKFGLVELIIGVLVFLVFDIIQIFGLPAAIVGSSVIKIALGPLQDIWLFLRGAYKGKAVAKLVLTKGLQRVIPGIPPFTIVWILTTYQANHPKVAAVAQVAVAKPTAPKTAAQSVAAEVKTA